MSDERHGEAVGHSSLVLPLQPSGLTLWRYLALVRLLMAPSRFPRSLQVSLISATVPSGSPTAPVLTTSPLSDLFLTREHGRRWELAQRRLGDEGSWNQAACSGSGSFLKLFLTYLGTIKVHTIVGYKKHPSRNAGSFMSWSEKGIIFTSYTKYTAATRDHKHLNFMQRIYF